MSDRYDRILDGFEKKLDKIIFLLNESKVELNRQHHDLYGNGKKGLFQEFDELEQEFSNLQKQVNTNSKYIWGAGVVASCIASIPMVKELLKELL